MNILHLKMGLISFQMPSLWWVPPSFSPSANLLYWREGRSIGNVSIFLLLLLLLRSLLLQVRSLHAALPPPRAASCSRTGRDPGKVGLHFLTQRVNTNSQPECRPLTREPSANTQHFQFLISVGQVTPPSAGHIIRQGESICSKSTMDHILGKFVMPCLSHFMHNHDWLS